MLEVPLMLGHNQHQPGLAQCTASAILVCKPGCQNALGTAGIGGLDLGSGTKPHFLPLAQKRPASSQPHELDSAYSSHLLLFVIFD